MQSLQAFARIDHDGNSRFPVSAFSCLIMDGLSLSLFDDSPKKPLLH